MKKILLAIMAILVSVGVVSCESRTDEPIPQEKPSTPPTPPTPKDSVNNDTTETWIRVSSSFEVEETKQATSTMTLARGNEIQSRYLNYIFDWTYTVPSRVYVTTQATPTKGSVSKINEETTSLSDTTKSVQRTFKCETNIPGYTGKIVSSRHEGYTLVGGKKEVFQNGNESCDLVSVVPGTKTEKTVNDSIFEVTPCTMIIRMSLGGKSWTDSKSTELWRFLRMKESNMPTPDVWVDEVVNITSSMTPEFLTLTGKDNIKEWHIATLVEGKDYVYIFVDGEYKGKEANPGEGKLNSAFYAEGSWHAASVTKDGEDFIYVFRVNGVMKKKEVPEHLALISSMSNFQSDGNAAQSWKLKTYKDTKTYSDGTWYRVWVQKNNSSERVYTFTVGVHQ